jgi:spore maturation protein CgeB
MENAFKEAYQEVRSIDWQTIRFNGGKEGLNILWDKIISECISFSPDLIFVQIQRPDVLSVDQFKKLSEYGFVINYTEDVREDISWYQEVASHIGLTIFTNMEDAAKVENGCYMMVSYNDVWYRPRPKTEKDYGEIIFIGNNYVNTNLNFPQAKERQDMIKFMEEKFGDKFKAYGIGQSNSMLSPEQCIEAYNNCKVAITQNHFKRKGYESDRGLNSMACGAYTILQHFEGIEEMFKDAPYLAVWKDFEGLEKLCNFYLYEANEDKKLMADYTKNNHNWVNRIKFIQSALILMQNKNVCQS